jgi:MurNAc alpha-1-phosphate uridylyltransferase
MNDSLPASRAEPRPASAPGHVVGDVAAVVLAAGEGLRLRPLTLSRPKALCPVGGVPLVDLAVARAGAATSAVAVNVHHGRAALEAHLAEVAATGAAVHVSVEEPVALGTAGAIGALRLWLAGRGALVVNADAWARADLAAFVSGWDRVRVRVLVAGGDGRFGPRAQVAAALLPWSDAAGLEPVPSGLYERCWAAAHAAGRLEAVATSEPFVDCGTPGRLLAANRLVAAGSATGSVVAPSAVVRGSVAGSVVGAGAVVDGVVRGSVVGEGEAVAAGELLSGAIRLDGRTVLVR